MSISCPKPGRFVFPGPAVRVRAGFPAFPQKGCITASDVWLWWGCCLWLVLAWEAAEVQE